MGEGCGRRHKMRIGFLHAVAIVLIPFAVAASPMSVKSVTVVAQDGKRMLSVSFQVPEHHHIYADEIAVRLGDGNSLELVNRPEPEQTQDPDTKEMTPVYGHDVTLVYLLPAAEGDVVRVNVRFRGCSDTVCFLPDSTNLVVASDVARDASGPVNPKAEVVMPAVAVKNQAVMGDWQRLAEGFRVAGSQVGYMPPAAFLAFLDHAEKHETTLEDRLVEMFNKRGVWTWLALLLIVIGGLGLNLTPCVLPMIPINIAIIGAGVGEQDGRFRIRGFVLGAVYGGAMAMVYGALGLAAVLTGTRFGTLNSSYVFNAVIAVVFLFLALAMFNVVHLVFSRFQGSVGAGKLRGGRVITAFLMGGVAALLAGSCVAPVVVSVLLISVQLCAGKVCIGLLLPFLLGLGMGLPWPFLGAGMSFLPKPGRWMEWVKYGFGVFITAMAIYYGHLAYGIYSGHRVDSKASTVAAQVESGWSQSLTAGFELASRDQKPVVIDFWATWCKSCVAMNETTFKDTRVHDRLAGFTTIKQQAEDLYDPSTKAMLDHFKVVGLPTYVVLLPVAKRN